MRSSRSNHRQEYVQMQLLFICLERTDVQLPLNPSVSTDRKTTSIISHLLFFSSIVSLPTDTLERKISLSDSLRPYRLLRRNPLPWEYSIGHRCLSMYSSHTPSRSIPILLETLVLIILPMIDQILFSSMTDSISRGKQSDISFSYQWADQTLKNVTFGIE